MFISKRIERVEITSRKKKNENLYSYMAIQLKTISTIKIEIRIIWIMSKVISALASKAAVLMSSEKRENIAKKVMKIWKQILVKACLKHFILSLFSVLTITLGVVWKNISAVAFLHMIILTLLSSKSPC